MYGNLSASGRTFLQYDETKIKLFGLKTKHNSWHKPKTHPTQVTIPTIKHVGGSIILMGCFSARGTQTDYLQAISAVQMFGTTQ